MSRPNVDFADPDEPVGAVLARMRRARGLSGEELGRLVGISQAKVSRIENGKGVSDPADIGRLARALNADEELVLQLMDRAETLHNRMTDWRPLPIGLAGGQRRIRDAERAAKSVRSFEPTVIHGLLQTSEYARSVLTAFQFQEGIVAGERGPSPTTIVKAVAARLQRQEVLADTTKRLHFVMMERALLNEFCPPEDMLGQITRLRLILREYEHVSIRIIPDDTRPAVPALHGFELFDDQIVMVDLFNTALTSRGRADIALYEQLFERFESASTTEVDPILAGLHRRYANVLARRD